MPSFDIVSKVDWHEIDNALNQARKEIVQRFDFKGTDTTIELKDEAFVLESSDEYKVRATLEVLEGKLAKRGLSLRSLERGEIEPASGARARQTVKVRSGVDTETAKRIVKSIKATKMKVQAAIQGDSVRVSGKKRDDLQEAIAHVKGEDFGLPLQYENFRD
jgi:uncharacterized protein YajQ (UPF0234 family)